MDIAEKQLGPEDKIKITLEGGKFIITNSYEGKQVGADVSIRVDAKAFLEELKAVIPGTIDDMIINVAEAALP